MMLASGYMVCFNRLVVDNSDDSESENDEDTEANGLDYNGEEEEFKFCGAVPDQSKSDHSGRAEAMVTDEQPYNATEGDDSFAPRVEFAEEASAVQQRMSEEVNDDSKNQQTTSTVAFNSTSAGVRVAHNFDNGTFPNSNTPND